MNNDVIFPNQSEPVFSWSLVKVWVSWSDPQMCLNFLTWLCGVVASTSAVSLYTHYMRHCTPMERYYCKILSSSCEMTAYSEPKISQNVNYTQRGTMEGPKAPSEARRREAPECRGGWGLGRGAVAPPQKILKFNSANLFIFTMISRQRQLFHPLFFIHLWPISVHHRSSCCV